MMDLSRNLVWCRPAAGLLIAALAVTGCRTDDLDRIAGPTPPASSIALHLSALDAQPGQRIAVSLFVDQAAYAADPLIGIKGTLSFDPSRLEYLGQELGDVFAIANEQDAGAGRLIFANLELGGLGGRTATFAFQVREPNYARSVRFVPDELVTKALRPLAFRGSVNLVGASDLAVPSAPRAITLRDWQQHVAPGLEISPIQAIAGENPPNHRYGDVNLDGNIDLFQDAFLAAGVAVGNFGLIAGSATAPNRDAIVAGNPVPFNIGGPGEPGEGTAIGGYQAGVWVIELFDAAAIATDAVNCAAFPAGSCPATQPGNQPVVGDLVRPQPSNRVIVSSDITSNTTWTADNIYELAAVIRVRNGATLTIEAGTRVEGRRPPTSSPLFVERDGRIVINGTRTKPVVFTCTGPETTKFKGCWAGFVVAGNAEINESNGTTAPITARNPGPSGSCQNFQNQAEGGGPLFGGCNNNDDSGVIRYLIVEYGGFESTPGSGNELNNLTMVGVGRNTVIEYVQTRNGLDDGFEWFGGTVNVRYIISTHDSDDSLDCSFGWSGSVQFAIVQHSPTDSDKGIECDNQNGSNHTALPRTTPVFYNVTMIGDGGASPDPQNESPLNNNSEDALHIRKGAHPILRNFLISGFGRGFRMDNGQTCSYDLNSATDPSRFLIENSIFHNVTFLEETSSAVPTPTLPTHDCVGEATFITTNMQNNSVLSGGTMFAGDPFNSLVPDFRLAAGSPAATGAAAPPAGNTFIQAVAFRGAIDPSLGPTAAPWYLGWTRGGAQQTP